MPTGKRRPSLPSVDQVAGPGDVADHDGQAAAHGLEHGDGAGLLGTAEGENVGRAEQGGHVVHGADDVDPTGHVQRLGPVGDLGRVRGVEGSSGQHQVHPVRRPGQGLDEVALVLVGQQVGHVGDQDVVGAEAQLGPPGPFRARARSRSLSTPGGITRTGPRWPAKKASTMVGFWVAMPRARRLRTRQPRPPQLMFFFV